MRLHTNFHDYYDYAVGYGIDDNVHYNRITKEVEIRIKPQFDFPHYSKIFLLGFCGQIYPLIGIKKYDWDYVEEIYYAYSFEDYKSKILEWRKVSKNLSYFDAQQEKELRQFFTNWSWQSNEIFLEYKTPAWIFELNRNRHTGFINPRLKDYGFDHVKDPFTAFQEISMYLSNILVEQKEVAEIGDKFRIEGHGFDLKKSFRKDKKQ